MHVSARLHHPEVSVSETEPTHLVIQVRGEETGAPRPELGLVFVIDRSGSMAWGNKMTTVTHSLRFLADQLCENDALALVSFASEATVDVGATKATTANVTAFQEALGSLVPGGGTNLDAALQRAVLVANDMVQQHPTRITRVIILTDGCTNVGECEPKNIVARLELAHPSVTISAMGVGEDCQHDLLGAIASRGHGSYGFIETPLQAAEALGTEIGGLLNLAATNVVVTIEPNAKYADIQSPLAATAQHDGSLTFEFGHLVAGQTKTVVYPVSVKRPKRPHARPVTVADVSVSALVDAAESVEHLKPKVHFVATPTRTDDTLSEAVDLALLAHAQLEAEKEAARGNFAGATGVLRSVGISSAAVSVLCDTLVSGYDSADAYAANSTTRNSMTSMLSPSTDLVGSSQAFDAVTARTVGGYRNDRASEMGLKTLLAVTTNTAGLDHGTEPLNSEGTPQQPALTPC